MELLTKHCPHCGTLINYGADEKIVCCLGCDRKMSVADLRNSLDTNSIDDISSNSNSSAPSSAMLVQVIDTAESGLAYLENFYENYDWEEYYYNSRIGISSITQMVEKNKIKNANNPSTWILEFKSIVLPVHKKIEGTKILEEEILQNYDFEDNTNVFRQFDTYAKIVSALISSQNNILKTLFNDIKYAEKYGGDAEDIKQMKLELAELNDALSQVKPVEELEDIPSVAELIRSKENEIANELMKRGIDAPAIYEQAIQEYMFNDDKTSCLLKFVLIRKYKDSEKYIRRINRLYVFENKLYDIAGKTYITKKKSQETPQLPVVDVKSNRKGKGKNEPQPTEETNLSNTFSLYEVIDGIAEEKPILTGITCIYCVFASLIYFLKNDKVLCSYNTTTKVVTKLDSGDIGCYKVGNEYPFYFNKERDIIFLRKALKPVIENPGCLASLKGKKPEIIPNRNNFSLLTIDLKNNKARNVVNELVDIEHVSGNKVFYTYVVDQKDEYETFMVYDFDKKDTDRVLEFGCHVHEVCGTKVVYSELNPSSYNLDLYVYDLEDKTSVLLENNVADFFRVIKDKVYYTVGNDEHCPLFSINLDGTGRTEIMSNIENIIFVHAGWMYVVKRWRSNVLLMKVSIDGTKRVRITNKFSKIVKIDNGYVYYIDIYGDLHIVRNDGEEDRIIAEDISSDCIIDSNLIYFTRKEQVSDNASALSLYSMDVEGFNLRKIEFNINAMAKYDESTIYFEKNEVVRYEITTPVSVKETTTTYRTFNLTRVYAYDKMTHEKKVVLTLGLPKPGHFQFNSGCFGKKVTNADETYVEVPIRHKYVRRNKIKAGSNYQKQVTANNSLTQTAQGCSNNPGCSSNSGCLQNK